VIAAGEISADTAALAPPLLMELPAANLNALWMLLETLARVAGNAAVNEMDARALAEVFAPKLAWHSPPKVTSKVGPMFWQVWAKASAASVFNAACNTAHMLGSADARQQAPALCILVSMMGCGTDQSRHPRERQQAEFTVQPADRPV